ncbi:MAG: hypothetical protein GXP08_01745 [Gammaproteobacteria bacterium]|nr:hypothetical protein [Gammaproteobacteria bacterium]
MTILFALLSACSLRESSVNTLDQLQLSVVFQAAKRQLLTDTRQRLLKWYDNTDRVYYGLKGPVKTLIIGTASEASQDTSTQRQLDFRRDGRVQREKYSDGNSEFVLLYQYSGAGVLQEYEWHVNNEKQGRIVFEYYPDGKLKNIQQQGYSRSDVSNLQFSYQLTGTGWFEISKPREAVDLPGYAQYLSDETLVWSNKRSINNDLGALYYLYPHDKVISSSVRYAYTDAMVGVGGYRYAHYLNGQLQSIKSFSGHNNTLFHTTDYRYNEIGLLVSEIKRVTGSSLFNSAINEEVEYGYDTIDEYGNWLRRQRRYSNNGSQSKLVYQVRSLRYYSD